MNLDNALLGFWFSVIAAGSTMLGWVIVAIKKDLSKKVIALTLLFAAIAMLAVSFFELIPGTIDAGLGSLEIFIWLILGAGAVQVLRFIGDKFYGPKHSLQQSATLVAIAVALHNIPEGAAAIATTIVDLQSGIATTIAIALHNIPEGVAIAATALAAAGSRTRAFVLVSIAALAEVSGAGIVLYESAALSEILIAKLLTLVAGIMITLSVLELIPNGVKSLRSLRDLDH
jgi:ZIP family zinc transporter